MMGKYRVSIYADGAVRGNGQPDGTIGMGVVLLFYEDDEVVDRRRYSAKERITPATNNLAELRAIEFGLEWAYFLWWNNNHLGKVVVYTDSQWSINAITGKWKVKHHLDVLGRIKEKIKRLKNVELEWVKGHDGNTFQEHANALAQWEAGTSRIKKSPYERPFVTGEADDRP